LKAPAAAAQETPQRKTLIPSHFPAGIFWRMYPESHCKKAIRKFQRGLTIGNLRDQISNEECGSDVAEVVLGEVKVLADAHNGSILRSIIRDSSWAGAKSRLGNSNLH
jgi:hypothetical protein